MAKAAATRVGAEFGGPVLERRNSQRAEFIVQVDYKSVDEFFSEFARDINEGGLFVETDTPPERGSLIDLRFRLPGSDKPVRALGTVVRVSDGDDGDPPGMGIVFGELDARTRDRVDDLVRKLRAAAP